ncbi:DUF3592 domain-containing protein [Niabella drilacis]|uniref:Uncharacterized protein n=1 Tax=Niabella drilacis (strain DSM 25811 / CCM 8410 / CCUG 62505 / LMG 26954 / E90) TaxID=1285928 RepID=A0A1G6IL13_NIADE|nr:DUF3592 domain-containing protein [Niabella drilacis]SDC07178.1 hypothetical protein SAMN04487894_101259 [Niabella drilacis]
MRKNTIAEFVGHIGFISFAAALLFLLNPYQYALYAFAFSIPVQFIFLRRYNNGIKNTLKRLLIISALAYVLLAAICSFLPWLQMKDFSLWHRNWKQTTGIITKYEADWKGGRGGKYAYSDIHYQYRVNGTLYQTTQEKAIKVYSLLWITEAGKKALKQEAETLIKKAIAQNNYVIFYQPGKPGKSRLFADMSFVRLNGSALYDLFLVFGVLITVILLVALMPAMATGKRIPRIRPEVPPEVFRANEITGIRKLRFVIMGFFITLDCAIILFFAIQFFIVHNSRRTPDDAFLSTSASILMTLQLLLALFLAPVMIIIHKRLTRFIGILRRLDTDSLHLYRNYIRLTPRMFAVAPPFVFEKEVISLLPSFSFSAISYNEIVSVRIRQHRPFRGPVTYTLKVVTHSGETRKTNVGSYAQIQFAIEQLFEKRPDIQVVRENF